MDNEDRAGQSAQRVYAPSDASDSPRGGDHRPSPYNQQAQLDQTRGRQGSTTATTPADTAWAPTMPYSRETFTPPSVHHWPAHYTVSGTGHESVDVVSAYPGGMGTEEDSTATLDDIILAHQMAPFQGPFDPLAPLGGASFTPWTIDPTIPPLPLTLSSATVDAGMGFSQGQSMSLPQLHSFPSSGTPPGAPSVGAPQKGRSKGQKRVREDPSPEEATVMADSAYASLKRQRNDATPSGRSSGAPGLDRGRGKTPDRRATDAGVKKPSTRGESGEATSRSQTARRQSQNRSREESRTPGACWRCRRYKKPCNNREGTCDTCSTSGFRIWPASLGCRRGDVQEFVDAILPDGMADAIDALTRDMPGTRSWRQVLEPVVHPMPAEIEGRTPDKWDHLCEKVISTRIFGQEFVDLFEILARHQRAPPKEHPLLNLCAAALSYSVDFYHRFVIVGEQSSQPEPKLRTARENVVQLRSALSNDLSAWLSLCLRGRMSDFPIAFMVASLTLCSLMIYADTVAALKAQTGEMVWAGSARDQISSLRTQLLTIAVDLLGVVAKGSKPLRFRCFQHDPGEPRSSEGMRLMAENTTSFDTMAGLQQWIVHHRAVFLTDAWAENPSYTPGVRAIQGMARFVKMAYGDLEND